MKRLLILLLILTVFVSGCVSNGDYINKYDKKTHVVIYRVTSYLNDSTASLTYTNEEGGTEQSSRARLPWDIRLYPDVKEGEFLYISAQNLKDYGDVKVQIIVDGHVWKESHSFGGYSIATASGILGYD